MKCTTVPPWQMFGLVVQKPISSTEEPGFGSRPWLQIPIHVDPGWQWLWLNFLGSCHPGLCSWFPALVRPTLSHSGHLGSNLVNTSCLPLRERQRGEKTKLKSKKQLCHVPHTVSFKQSREDIMLLFQFLHSQLGKGSGKGRGLSAFFSSVLLLLRFAISYSLFFQSSNSRARRPLRSQEARPA